MPCDVVRDKDGRVIKIACSPRGFNREVCDEPYCDQPVAALCDFPMGGGGMTCDRRMCQRHRNSVGHNLDHCNKHKKDRGDEVPRKHDGDPPHKYRR
jgi:hypothetical protein